MRRVFPTRCTSWFWQARQSTWRPATANLSQRARSTPVAVFRQLVALGGGRMLGRRLFHLWEQNALDAEAIRAILQSADPIDSDAFPPARGALPRLVCLDLGSAGQILPGSR